MDIDPGVLKTAYSGNKSRRHMLAKAMNEELEIMSQELNDLLNIEEEKYHLRVVLESSNMEFIIEYGDGVARNLDKQSQGFRWLFNLYFNLIKGLEFDPGDIVLIDEFGDSLGFSTVEVLTRKLRDFGRKNGITFILATQNPMAVDINHLDEVRLVVPQDNGSSVIINEFDQCGETDDHDVLLPVLNGLMVSRNFMRTENRRTVFVEGVTDYFYLNAFAEVLRSKGKDIDIDFISIKGLGIKKDDTILLVKQILSIERNPVLLIDSDETGKAARKTIEKDKTGRITVADIGELFEGQKSEIEDLFSEEDFKRFCLSKEVKKFDEAFCVGYSIVNDYESLSDETKENFEKVIEYIATI
ncbi:MAG: ATP-binding protein [Candidatus Methanomethylophilaceae archaeon]|nr:ATP-binding protein [Candidatus Methanomethylophilaceae archaeon]